MGSRLNPERMKMGGLVKHGSLAVAAATGSTLPSSDCRRHYGVASSNLSCIVSRLLYLFRRSQAAVTAGIAAGTAATTVLAGSCIVSGL